ncbi:YARHG domain-containing protein [Candidatus Berkelbacteria bacterium]|nr:YARHG domain-containing protein [Candidatus Berkelbacteria bacterium]
MRSLTILLLLLPLALFGCDNLVTVQDGTEVTCSICKKIIKKEVSELRVKSEDAHKYKVKKVTEVCSEHMVEVTRGEETVCSSCGKQISRNVETVKVKADEKDAYGVKITKTICDGCEEKLTPKQTVSWGLSTPDVWGHQKFGPFCPHCRFSVATGAETCGHCGKEYHWVSGTCSQCHGYGDFPCPQCKGKGYIITKCPYCGGRGQGEGALLGNTVGCVICKGTGTRKNTCYYRGCNGKGRYQCDYCDGQGVIGGTKKIRGTSQSRSSSLFGSLSSTRPSAFLTESDLAGKTAWELDIMRNQIYALHGRKFRRKDLQDYFNKQSWYQPRDGFSDSQLNQVEKRNAALIAAYQKTKR